MWLNSLAFRLFATAAAWTILVLPIAGVLILSLYRQDTEQSFEERLKTLLTVIQADSIDAPVVPGPPKDAGEPLFEITHSGWYWQIHAVAAEGPRLVSPSLATESLPSPFAKGRTPDARGTYWMDAAGPGDQPIRIAEVIYALGDEPNEPRYSFAVAGPLDWLDARVAAFRFRLSVALALAGLALVAVTLFQVRFGLRPLRNIERNLAAIRSGEAAELVGDLPAEILPLQVELNALVRSNQEIVERARTQVGNLAHALKTPLAVIANEAGDDKGPLGRTVATQSELMRHQINYYLDRARMAARAGTIGRVTEVRPVAEALRRTLERIYSEKKISILFETRAALPRFQGERQDLEEMLGNLLDNACKWAVSVVRLTIDVAEPPNRTGPRRLLLVIDDDGPGLTREQRDKLGARGVRLDETKPGSGLGLSIVGDLAHSYRGSLSLETSDLGGLSARLNLPAA